MVQRIWLYSIVARRCAVKADISYKEIYVSQAPVMLLISASFSDSGNLLISIYVGFKHYSENPVNSEEDETKLSVLASVQLCLTQTKSPS